MGPDTATLARDLVVVGLARDCEATLEPAVTALARVLPPFARVRWLVIESDSSDATPQVLQRLAATLPHFDYRCLGRLRDTLPERTARIAHCRNHYLDLLRQDPERERIGHVLVADLDGVAGLDADGLASCWARDDWAACCANPRGPYYDIWALRHPAWCPGDCWQQSAFLVRHGRPRASAEMASVFARMVQIAPDADWIEVDSAFGGLALYRAQALLEARYEGLGPDGQPQCEHVPLHAAIRARGGRLFINPRMTTDGMPEHLHFWNDRRQLQRTTRGLAFRALLWLFYGRARSKAIRRLIDSVV